MCWQRFLRVLVTCVAAMFWFSSAMAETLIIVGGGHVGLIKVLLANEHAKKAKQNFNAIIYTKDKAIEETTAANIWNSHTHNEFGAVIPPVEQMAESMNISFDKGGIRVPDVPGILEHQSSKKFIDAVYKKGADINAIQEINTVVPKVGSASMKLWRKLYESANPKLKAIMQECNFNPCADSEDAKCQKLYSGYRIDLIYNTENVLKKAENMLEEYRSVGYKYGKILTPDEVLSMDKSLTDFVCDNSEGTSPNKVWKKNVVAVWRPGGCVDTQRFLPKLLAYLREDMGDRLKVHFNKEAVGVDVQPTIQGHYEVKGLTFADGTSISAPASDEKVWFDINPGEAVGTLERLGFHEPPCAGFAGCSLSLTVPMTGELKRDFADFRHHMEVHTPGKVLAWQARAIGDSIFVGGAGTKAFYGPLEPKLDQQFACINNLAQLQMFNDVLPQVVSVGLGRNTRGQQMTMDDLEDLVENKKARRWVGRRSVRFDNMFTWGFLYYQGHKVTNAMTGTHAGSGGGSLSLIMALLNAYLRSPEQFQAEIDELGWNREFIETLLRLGDSRTSS
jgi:hypothetical protein